jgi:hypothetical protein
MLRHVVTFSFVIAVVVVPIRAVAQGDQPKPGTPGATPGTPVVERLGTNLFRVGTIRVDTAGREISVAGTINTGVATLEFIANTRGGLKAYETAITLDTDAVTFNTALLLIGLDRTRVRNAPTAHFDPATPDGDQVQIAIDCPGRECSRMPAERLMYDTNSKQTVPEGKWVYTGSSFLPDGRYLAHIDGTLVGFVHDPATIIEYAAGAGLNRWGSIVLNPNLGLSPGTAVTMTVKAVVRPPAPAPAR